MERNQELSIEQIQGFKGKYPIQVWYLSFIEMWERFCFYGMRGMLTVFMIDQLFMDQKSANLQYGATQAFVYAFTFIGGLFADKILGFRKSLFWGGLLMIAGSCILATNPQEFFFIGVAFTIVGTGFFKPNISTMVGRLYKENDTRRETGFSLFYSGINAGALIGGYVCVYVGKTYSWNMAFGLAAIAMSMSLIAFLFVKKSLGPIGLSPISNNPHKKALEISVFAGSLLIIPLLVTMVSKTQYTDWFMYIIGPLTIIYLVYEMTKLTLAENKKLIAALVFIVFSILFWAIFEQAGGSLNIFAQENLSHNFLGIIELDPNGVNNSANSFFVILFAPFVGLLWLALAKKGKEPNSVVKFGLAFIFLAGAFYVFFGTRFFADAQGVTSLGVFTSAYLVITLGELCLSPIGLSLMTKLSPMKLQGVMMGMWFLASAYGQYVAGLLGADLVPGEGASLLEKLYAYTGGYKQLAVYALGAGIILLVISPWVKKLMQSVK